MAEEQKEMTLEEKLGAIQAELKSPKNAYNSFGGYKYRSLEMILESVKPLLQKYGLTMVIYDEPVQIGDRFYIKATAKLFDGADKTGAAFVNTAYAREPDHKTKMDDAQVTGTSSSYARKYCLNGLFLIDDTKDPDTDEYHVEAENRENAGKKLNKSSKGTNTQESNEKPENGPANAEIDHSKEPCTDVDLAVLENLCGKLGWQVEQVFKRWPKVTKGEYSIAVNDLKGRLENANKRTA